MNSITGKFSRHFSLAEAIQARVSSYLYQVYAHVDGLLGDLDRWSQRRITDENMAKLALVLRSDDPAETCYRDLIREIDTEAQSGIFLVGAEAKELHLCLLASDPGVSGELDSLIGRVAPIIFADEARRSVDDLDLVWITIRAYHDRAHVDASVSEIIMSHFVDDARTVREMTAAMRSIQYSYHEDFVRRQCDLPCLLDDREMRDLTIMVTEFARRAGNYADRNRAIRRQANVD